MGFSPCEFLNPGIRKLTPPGSPWCSILAVFPTKNILHIVALTGQRRIETQLPSNVGGLVNAYDALHLSTNEKEPGFIETGLLRVMLIADIVIR